DLRTFQRHPGEHAGAVANLLLDEPRRPAAPALLAAASAVPHSACHDDDYGHRRRHRLRTIPDRRARPAGEHGHSARLRHRVRRSFDTEKNRAGHPAPVQDSGDAVGPGRWNTDLLLSDVRSATGDVDPTVRLARHRAGDLLRIWTGEGGSNSSEATYGRLPAGSCEPHS